MCPVGPLSPRYIRISYFAGVYVDVPLKVCLGADPKVQLTLQATQAVKVRP